MAKKALQEKGQCALCRCIIYQDDANQVTDGDVLFCSESCRDEARDDEQP